MINEYDFIMETMNSEIKSIEEEVETAKREASREITLGIRTKLAQTRRIVEILTRIHNER